MNVAAGPGHRHRRGSRVGSRDGAPLLGEIMVQRGAVTRMNLAEALAQQPASGRPLGGLLVARGWAAEGAVTGALAEQWRLDSVDLEVEPPDRRLLQPALCLTYVHERVLPWRLIDGMVIHVTDRPEAAATALAAVDAPDSALAVVSTRQLDAALGALLAVPLAARAAARTAPGESVRGLGRARGAMALTVLVLAAALVFGGEVGLVAGAAGLLTLNAATTVLRLLALVAGLRRPGSATAEARTAALSSAGAVPLAAHRPLPAVTLMVPLYREAGMVGEITRALAALDYPPELLDVKLLLEADDTETRAAVDAAELPGWITPVVVPAGNPRTKPRAMNFALDFARGEVVGILDAEDRPAPDQLARVVAALREAPPEVACVQCQLSYYNAAQNWIARCFEVEYAIWFEVLLPGFRRLRLPIPLGGTSVYFRRAALERLGGWDAHNVTEDADLGMRLARRGMRCEVLDSVTGEEANCRAVPWIRQRSRWLKGYLLTWLSHMRAPGRLLGELGLRGFFGLNVLFLGAAVTYLAMPLFWVSVIGGLVIGRSIWGTAVPPWVLWPLGVSLALGQAVMLGCAALAMLRRGRPGLLAWVPTLPLYWTLGAVAAWKAVIELAWAPYYWDKTRHGLSADWGAEWDAEWGAEWDADGAATKAGDRK